MIEQELHTITRSGIQVNGKILGEENTGQLLICAHGFGVKSDSWGMYNIICEVFKYQFLTTRFHFTSFDDFTNDTYVFPYSTQVEKLSTVINKMEEKFKTSQTTIIAHSQGTIVTSMFLKKFMPKIKKVVFLAPPVQADLVEKMTGYFGERPGSEVNLDGTSIFTRSNGSRTYVPKEFWSEAKNVNPLEELKWVSKNYNTVFVRPMQDKVVKDAEYEKLSYANIGKIYELQNGHDFIEDNRAGLLQLLNKIL